ncbi:DNA-binding protein [Streptomyces lydicus]|uniref:DNA-binding protein n=1 Tax=Streptomyces lydicus TaxID=47763 RepID=A0A3Q9KBN0_9ACTN|nr:DNA-binding protein [Streptomyces lydicus]
MPQPQNSESTYTEWRHKVRDGLKPLQNSLVQLFQETQLFRIYSSTLMPGLLQTEGYAAAVLRTVADFQELPFDDSTEAAQARVERSRIIHEPERRFVLLVEEAVLYHQLGDTEVMAAQLEYLLTTDAMPSVSLGIIPMATRERVQWPRETLHMYDDNLVSVELVSAKVDITRPSEIALYLKAFEQLRSMAVYGTEARALILKALEVLR